MDNGPGQLIDDDLAHVNPWGFEIEDVKAPTLFLHGARDRVVPPSHGKWLAGHCNDAEIRLFPDDGQLSVLRRAAASLDWIRDRVG